MRASEWLAALTFFAASMVLTPAHAADTNWDQTKNVTDAAKRLAEMQRRQGSEAVLKFLEACYKTHMLAEKYTEGLEACMAQDYMLSQLLAVIYSKVPPEKLADMKAPSPEVIARAMRGRFLAIFQQYNISQEQADSLKKAVDEHAMPLFIKLVFPNSSKKKDGDEPSPHGGAKGGDGSEGGGDSGSEGGKGVHIPIPEGSPK
ncbi:MAG: hypothetical protein AB7O90_06620 [Hyphomicrobium sp.]